MPLLVGCLFLLSARPFARAGAFFAVCLLDWWSAFCAETVLSLLSALSVRPLFRAGYCFLCCLSCFAGAPPLFPVVLFHVER